MVALFWEGCLGNPKAMMLLTGGEVASPNGYAGEGTPAYHSLKKANVMAAREVRKLLR